MTITVAILCENGGQSFSDCLQALTRQRVINADVIKIYDLESTDNTRETAITYGCTVKPLSKKNFINETALMRYILMDNMDSEILICLAPDVEIDASGISELFRYFLKYPDLAVVTGRQVSNQENRHLTRFAHSCLYPFTSKDYPVWHLMRIFSSFRMVAYRTKYLAIPGVIPDVNVPYYADLYIPAKLASLGYRIIYNPLAICVSSKIITPANVYVTSYCLYRFLKQNLWLRQRWHMRTSDIAEFFVGFERYLKIYSSIPFLFLYARILHLIALSGVLMARMTSLLEDKDPEKSLIKNLKKRRKE